MGPHDCIRSGLEFSDEYKSMEHVRTSAAHHPCLAEGCLIPDFSSKAELLEHARSTIGHYFCTPCMTVFGDQTTHKVHRSRTHLCCHKCQRAFLTSGSLSRHWRLSSAEHRACKKCDVVFHEAYEYLAHILESNQHYYCCVCNVECTSQLDLDYHMENSRVHLRNPISSPQDGNELGAALMIVKGPTCLGTLLVPYTATVKYFEEGGRVKRADFCNISAMSVFSQFSVEELRFVDYKNPNIDTYPCGTCDRRFATSDKCGVHKIGCDKDYGCSICKMGIQTREDWFEHCASVNHAFCAKCVILFDSKRELDCHLLSDSNHFMCGSCLRDFDTAEERQKHALSHSKVVKIVNNPGWQTVVKRNPVHHSTPVTTVEQLPMTSKHQQRLTQATHAKFPAVSYLPRPVTMKQSQARHGEFRLKANLPLINKRVAERVAVSLDLAKQVQGTVTQTIPKVISSTSAAAPVQNLAAAVHPPDSTACSARPSSLKSPTTSGGLQAVKIVCSDSECSTKFRSLSQLIGHWESGKCITTAAELNFIAAEVDTENGFTVGYLLPHLRGDIVREKHATESHYDMLSRVYCCPYCSKSYGGKLELTNHLIGAFHDVKPYCCPAAGCGERFTHLSILVAHTENTDCGFHADRASHGVRVLKNFIVDITPAERQRVSSRIL